MKNKVTTWIKAHAETYSFNIESELFQQLTKEQQGLWRKEIEQAVISGGEVGVELANDERYKEPAIGTTKSIIAMDKQKYYSIREDINIVNKITGFIDSLDKIMETYWQTKEMTLEKAKEFLWERYLKFENKIREELNVEQ